MTATVVHFMAYGSLAKLTFYNKSLVEIDKRLKRIYPQYEPQTIITGRTDVLLKEHTPEYRQFLIHGSFIKLADFNNIRNKSLTQIAA